MGKMPNEDLHGTDLTQGTVIVMSFGIIALIAGICLGVAFAGVIPAVVGAAIFVLATLLCLPNLRNFLRGKKKERLIRQGKLPPEQSKSFHPGNRFDD